MKSKRNQRPSDQDWHRLREFLISSAFELFTGVKLEVRHVDAPQPRNPKHLQDMAGVIGFGGEHLSATLAIRAPRLLVERSHPLRAAQAALPIGDIEDWMGELTNRLLGRLKNRCASHGLELFGGIPRVLGGVALDLSSGTDTTTEHFHFDCDGVDIDVALEVVIDDGASLFSAVAPEHAAAEEGSVLFF